MMSLLRLLPLITLHSDLVMPLRVCFWPFSVNSILRLAKSHRISPSVESHCIPKTISQQSSGSVRISVENMYPLIFQQKSLQRNVDNMLLPLTAETLTGWTVSRGQPNSRASCKSRKLCVLPLSIKMWSFHFATFPTTRIQ